MAKPLTIIPPTSSVAKLLDPGIGAAALRPVGPPAGGPVHGRAGVQDGPAVPPRPGRPHGRARGHQAGVHADQDRGRRR